MQNVISFHATENRQHEGFKVKAAATTAFLIFGTV